MVLFWLGALCGLAAAEPPKSPAPERLPRTNLLVYRTARGELAQVKSKKDWQQRKREILAGMQTIMGPLPGKEKRCRLDPWIEEETDCGSYVRRRLSYAPEPNDRVPAYLLVPKEALAGKRRLPAVLVLHPTDQKDGYRSSVEQLSPRFRAYAHELAEHGFVTLVPAYPLMADYQPDLKALGYESGTMKAIWNNKRGLDYLDSLPFVKHGKFGALGHSLGGHNALYTAAFEDRIEVVVSSCGFDSFLAYYDGNPENWRADRGWCQERYMPELIGYHGRLQEIPFDFHEILAVLAPRRVFVNAPLRDSNFRWRSVDEIIAAASPVYEMYGAARNLTVEHPDSEHDFPSGQRQQAYRLLETTLRKGE